VISATATCTFASTRLDTPEDRRWHQPAPGRGLEVVDAQDRPAPIGQVGQVRVSTADGPAGYMDDEAATQAFFRGGYFYPGDLAVRRQDGRIALQGRVTDVINVNGDKLSPAPIEAALAEILGVTGVCLFSMQNDDAEEEIHLIIEAPAPLPIAPLTQALRQHLSAYPRAKVSYTPALPRNPMGKLLRQAAKDQAAGRAP
jgi:acyl-coenzyme A synthetase/AMP-(fatty) acid ligase